MRASGLLLGGGNIAQENKYTLCNAKQNDGRVRKAPSACQKARAEVGQGDFPFDDCQQTWRSPFIRGRQRHADKKRHSATWNRLNNARNDQKIRWFHSQSFVLLSFRQGLGVVCAFSSALNQFALHNMNAASTRGPRSWTETSIPAVEKARAHRFLPPSQATRYATTFHGTRFFFLFDPLRNVSCANILTSSGPAHSSPRWDLSRLKPHP